MTAIVYPTRVRLTSPRSKAGLRRATGSRPSRREVYAVRRTLAALLVVTALALGWAGLGAADSMFVRSSSTAAVPVAARTWVVRSGDTVWGIARSITTRGDVRVTVQRIVALNGSADLQVGERLVLP